jgi:hypothetical protein
MDMIEVLVVIAMIGLLPLAYFRGKRTGFERHQCVWVPDAEDRAPKTYVTVQCPACGEGVDCALHIRHRSSGGVPTVIATVDGTDLEHHTLTHVDELRRPAA